MYTRRRATRYFTRTSRIGASWTIACIFTLVFLSSCAHRFSSDHLAKADEILTQAVSSLRFSGEGRGRLHYRGKSVGYSFESLKREDSWIIGIQIPFHGEEVFEIRGLGARNMHFRGSLYDKASIAERRQLKRLIVPLAKIMRLDKQQGLCRVTRKSERKIKGFCGKDLWIMTPDTLSFEQNGFSFKAQGRRIKFWYQQKEMGLIGLDLTFSESFSGKGYQ